MNWANLLRAGGLMRSLVAMLICKACTGLGDYRNFSVRPFATCQYRRIIFLRIDQPRRAI
ncbi:hypothetical protein SAMN06295987_101333 [Novosphingobium mathurense]|uniref:Uncharacterized protein n=1 Tax=Novosphingobium mathurense TaxID=428990 RepID=A0A1U6GT25_9SPHN|nr:hypothetical protein SAMN06295987_101333 [Novosphingobium mathurense]